MRTRMPLGLKHAGERAVATPTSADERTLENWHYRSVRAGIDRTRYLCAGVAVGDDERVQNWRAAPARQSRDDQADGGDQEIRQPATSRHLCGSATLPSGARRRTLQRRRRPGPGGRARRGRNRRHNQEATLRPERLDRSRSGPFDSVGLLDLLDLGGVCAIRLVEFCEVFVQPSRRDDQQPGGRPTDRSERVRQATRQKHE
jgi:hypothetical protein